MNLPPLSHHDILRLAEPLVRQGWLVDLPASDRSDRQLAFRTRHRPAAAPTPVIRPAAEAPAAQASPPGGGWLETLHLDASRGEHLLLRRTLQPAQGPAAVLTASGADVAELLARLDAVPAEAPFSAGPGWQVARSYSTDLPRGAAGTRSGTAALVLTQAELHAEGLVLTLVNRLPELRGIAADLDLRALPTAGAPATDAAARPALPEDLLAVLGWDWARLVPKGAGWTSKLRLRGPVLRRSRTAEAMLDRAGAHLARVLTGPPARFHDEHRLARWGVVLRRGIPSLMAVLMVVGALLLPQVADPSTSGLWMALHYLPIGLLALAFSLQELARFEIPPLPRRSRAPRWPGLPAAPGPAGEASAAHAAPASPPHPAPDTTGSSPPGAAQTSSHSLRM